MDPRWQSTTHVRPPTMHDIRDDLRRQLVLKVLEQVSAGHWSALFAADQLSSVGLSASAEKVKAAMAAKDRMFESVEAVGFVAASDERAFLVGRLARPLGAITQRGAA